MKLLFLVVPRELRDEAEAALEVAAGTGFTEIPDVFGEGASGPRFGSRQAPGVSDLVLVALSSEKLPGARAALSSVAARHGQHLRAFVVPLEEAWS